MDICFALFEHYQHGIANKKVFSAHLSGFKLATNTYKYICTNFSWYIYVIDIQTFILTQEKRSNVFYSIKL